MPPSEILSGLYIGNDTDSTQVDIHELVVNCTPNLPFHAPSKRCVRVPVRDDPSDACPLYMILRDTTVLSDIHETLDRGRSVFVHCQAGAQRSPAVVAAYLIRHRNMTAQEAIEFVKKKRSQAFTRRVNFGRTLELMEAETKLEA